MFTLFTKIYLENPVLRRNLVHYFLCPKKSTMYSLSPSYANTKDMHKEKDISLETE